VLRWHGGDVPPVVGAVEPDQPSGLVGPGPGVGQVGAEGGGAQHPATGGPARQWARSTRIAPAVSWAGTVASPRSSPRPVTPSTRPPAVRTRPSGPAAVPAGNRWTPGRGPASARARAPRGR